MINSFVSIDFETSYGHIPCSIGIVEFLDGKPVNEYYSLIRPIDLKFNPINSRINGIYLEDVFEEREFDIIWDEIEHYFVDRIIVTHNSSFDISVLEKTLDYYKIQKPDYKLYCTLNMSQTVLNIDNYKLSTLAKYYGINQVDYHNSLEDAFVCGHLFLNLLEKYVEIEKNIKPKNLSSNKQKNSYQNFLRSSSQKIIENPFKWNESDKLTRKTFVVSGVFEKFSRDDLKKAIEDNGGKVGSSISSKTDYVVAGDNMGPAKLEKANQLGIAIISEDDFIGMIG